MEGSQPEQYLLPHHQADAVDPPDEQSREIPAIRHQTPADRDNIIPNLGGENSKERFAVATADWVSSAHLSMSAP